MNAFIKHVRSSLVALAGASALVSLPAEAGTWTLNDGFESNPAANWFFAADGVGYGGFSQELGSPRTGNGLAWVNSWTGSFSSVGRVVHLRTGVRSCTLRAYLLSMSDSLVNVEVIEPSSWTYLSLNQVRPDHNWRAYTTAWVPAQSDVVIRFSVLTSASSPADDRVMIDDISVSCLY